MNSRRLMSNSSTPLGGGGTAALRHFGLANVAVDTVITVNQHLIDQAVSVARRRCSQDRKAAKGVIGARSSRDVDQRCNAERGRIHLSSTGCGRNMKKDFQNTAKSRRRDCTAASFLPCSI